MRKFPFYKQHDRIDCGPTCLRMICSYYGKDVAVQKLRDLCQLNRKGVNLLGISEAAENLGFRTLGVKLTIDQLSDIELPCILYWTEEHFVVLYKVKNNQYYIADPGRGAVVFSAEQISRLWFREDGTNTGLCLVINPTPKFYEIQSNQSAGWKFIFRYFLAYRQLFVQLLFGMGIGTLLALITPFLTQAVVDIGIGTRDVNFIYIILIAQVMLFLGTTSINFLRSWILLHISTRVNISILTDFLIKLMKLPMSFYETKSSGDIMQRMKDQQRIETFLTGSTLNTLFSMINLVVFSFVLAYYNMLVFVIFVACTLIYTVWLLLFMKRRRELNYKEFDNSSSNSTNIVELVNGMQEIRLNNCERQKRWGWENIQASLFEFKISSLALTQYQQGGSMFINQGKNILITFLSAKAVIDGDMTIGAMMAVQYIVGQISSPVEQILALMQSYQDAKISMERLNEIHEMDDEESAEKEWVYDLPAEKGIDIRNLTFRYPGAGTKPALDDINLYIPEGKTTAIVGMSGSGKTTILKLLLRFYHAEKGGIRVGNTPLDSISFRYWRGKCGVVMQDSYIFADTIANNIGIVDETPDPKKMQDAIRVANIQEFIDELPLGVNTRIGTGGNGLSQGQRQRLLIARAIYKDPQYIFFDEATNALDATNERIIMDNLNEFFLGRTVIVVAHRLSTVSNADNIIFLDNGKIIEQGSHYELTSLRGKYYGLVKNQLELGV